jgi:hypothetical protein
MDLDRIFTQLELIGNLLGLAYGRYKQHGLSFARRQGVEALPQFGNMFDLFAPGSIVLDAALTASKQRLLAPRFGEELDSPHRYGNVTMTADEYDWELDPRLRQRTLKFQSARPGSLTSSTMQLDRSGCLL